MAHVFSEARDSSAIIDGFYDAALGAITWSEALERFADKFPSLKLAIAGYEGRLDNTCILAQSKFELVRQYEDYYSKLNPWTDLLLTAPLAPAVSWAHDWVPFEDLKNTEFYNDFIRPQGNVATGFASTLFKEKDRFLVLAANVSFRHLKDAEAAAKAFEIVGPHLRRAFELYRRVEGNELSTRLMEQALNKLTTAVFIVDNQMKVIFASAEAEEVQKRQNVVRVGFDRRMRFVSDNDQKAVVEHIARSVGRFVPPCDLFVRLQTPRERPFVAFVSPLPTQDDAFGPGSSAHCEGYQFFLVFLIDPAREPRMDLDVLSTILGITAAEAALALALLADKSLTTYAEERGISSHTVRVQLKSLMAKTDTHRQAELVNLLSRILTPISLGNV